VTALPPQIEAFVQSAERHHEAIKAVFGDDGDGEGDGASTSSLDDRRLQEIKAVLMQSGSLLKQHSAASSVLSEESDALRKQGDRCRAELNASIEAINAQYVALKAQFEALRAEHSKRRQEAKALTQNGNDSGHGVEEEAEYKILYEASQQKVSAKDDELQSARTEIARLRDSMERAAAKAESAQIETERAHRGEVQRLMSCHRIELEEAEIARKCAEDQLADLKAHSTAKAAMDRNADRLLIDNLKRENRALTAELEAVQQSMATLSPNSAAKMTPCNVSKRGNGPNGGNGNEPKGDDLKDYGQHIRASPLNQRVQDELLSIWKRKDLEKSIENLKAELLSTRTQLAAKKALVEEFETLLRGQQSQQKEAMMEVATTQRVNNLYSVLTATKVEVQMVDVESGGSRSGNTGNGMDVDSESKEQEMPPERALKREVFSCRTAHRERGTMMEYMLSFGCNEGEEEAVPYLDYQLVNAHNLDDRPLNESLKTNMTFYAKNGPMFMNTVIRQLFGKKSQ